MTEEEWLTSDDPAAMLSRQRSQSERKSHLFACACSRRIVPLFRESERVLQFIEAVEDSANGPETRSDLEDLRTMMWFHIGLKWSGNRDPDTLSSIALQGLWPALQLDSVLQGCSEGTGAEALSQALDASTKKRSYRLWNRGPDISPQEAEEIHQHAIGAARITFCGLLRDIFGNPFRPLAFDPNWRTSTVVAIAKSMYESRDFSPMPILADALQDAGCEHADILDHCCGTGPHVRGCWVVDLVLGKS